MHSNKKIDKFLKQDPNYKYSCPWCRIKKKNTNDKIKGKIRKLEEFEEKSKVYLGNKIKNNYLTDNFEFLDYKPKLFRKKDTESHNHLSNTSI